MFLNGEVKKTVQKVPRISEFMTDVRFPHYKQINPRMNCFFVSMNFSMFKKRERVKKRNL